MRKLLRWLKPSLDPVISIGVGDKAYAPLSMEEINAEFAAVNR